MASDLDIKNIILSNFNDILEFSFSLAPRIVIAAAVLIMIFYLEKIISKAIKKITSKSKSPKSYLGLYLKVSKILFVFTGIILSLHILGFKGLAKGVFAGGGVVTIVMGFAFREIGENFFAGLLLSLSRPFRIGDTIKSLDVEGVVKSIQIRHTHIRSVDGKDIYVPSSQIYKNTLINYTKDNLRRFDFNIGIDYASDLIRACDIIDRELNMVDGILKDPLSPGCSISNLLSGYIEIRVYFWINVSDVHPIQKVMKDTVSRVKNALIAESFILSCNTSSNLSVNLSPSLAELKR